MLHGCFGRNHLLPIHITFAMISRNHVLIHPGYLHWCLHHHIPCVFGLRKLWHGISVGHIVKSEATLYTMILQVIWIMILPIWTFTVFVVSVFMWVALTFMWVASIFVWVALAFIWVASIFMWVAFTFMWVAMILVCFVWGCTVVHVTWTRMHCVHGRFFCGRLSIMSGRCHICRETATCFYSTSAHCNLSSDSVCQVSLCLMTNDPVFNHWSRGYCIISIFC